MVQERILLSIIIPCLNQNDQKLKELLASIRYQDFPTNQMEVLVISEGTSESAKAIGIRRAKGEVVGILASDNELMQHRFLTHMTECAKENGACYPQRYSHIYPDNALNRYFALIGGNDPMCYYMGKNDKASYLNNRLNQRGSIGDNGFFIRKSLVESTDLDNYYHIDNAIEANVVPSVCDLSIWHKTGGNIFSFFAKRYRYGLQHAFNPNRRWHLVDFHQPKDIVRLLWFIFCSATLVEPFILSLRGYLKIRDRAWFIHPVACLMTLLTYACLVAHLSIRGLIQSLSAPMVGARA